ncbi:MAG: LPS assembly protein LptD [Acidobacteriota bacterium]
MLESSAVPGHSSLLRIGNDRFQIRYWEPSTASLQIRRMRLWFCSSKLTLVLLILVAVPGSSWAQSQNEQSALPPASDDTVTIRAVTQRRIGEHEFEAEGDVEVRYLDMLLKADKIHGNNQSQDVEGEGHVYFEQGQQKIHAQRFHFNLATKTGTFFEVKGRADPGFIFEAEEVEKLGEDRYRVKNGFVTACEDRVPKWSFTVSEGFLRVDKNVVLKNTFLRIKKLPVFFTPYLVAPTNERKRQSGFLIPATSSSSNRGRAISDAFYLTLGRSADLTATGEYYSLRGVAGGLQFRARSSERSSIFAEGFFAKDRLGQGGQSATVIADTRFDNGFRAVADVFIVTSEAFRQVYGESFNTIVRPDEVSSGFLTKNFSSYSLNVFSERRLTLFEGKPVTTRTFPSFNLFGHNRQVKDWPVYFSFDTAVDGLSRSDRDLSTPPLVQRFDFYPRVTVPLRDFKGMTLTPSFGWRETFYSDRVEPAVRTGVVPRNLVRSAFDFQARFTGPGVEKIFELGDHRYKHLIEPEVHYRYFTGIGELRDIIRFDERDIMSNTNEVEYAIQNRFFSRRSNSEGGTTNAEFLSIRIAQKYFFDPTFGGALVPGQRNVFFPLNTLSAFSFQDGERHLSPIITRVRVTPASRYTADFRMDYDQRVHKIRAASVTGAAYVENKFLALTYYNTRNLPPTQFPSNQIRATLGYGNSTRIGMNAAFSFNYDFRSSVFQYSTSQLAYNWDCCGIALEWRQFDFGARKESQVRFSFSLKNIGSFGSLRKQERLF